MFKRIVLFVLTNIAVVVSITIIAGLIEHFFGFSLLRNGGTVAIIVVSSIIGFVGAFVSLAMSKSLAKSAYGINLIDSNSSNPKINAVYQLVQQIAYTKHITMPEVGYYKSSEVNAFATGMSKDSALVAVSTGLLDTMTLDEIEGVIGHEMAHILNGDMVTSTLLQGVLNTFVVAIARIIAGIISSRADDDEGAMSWGVYYLVVTVAEIILGIGAMVIQMRYSRQREFAADRGGAYFTSKHKMISGLRRLQTIDPASTVSDNYATFKIFGGKNILGLFHSHPSLDERIKRLEETSMLSL